MSWYNVAFFNGGDNVKLRVEYPIGLKYWLDVRGFDAASASRELRRQTGKTYWRKNYIECFINSSKTFTLYKLMVLGQLLQVPPVLLLSRDWWGSCYKGKYDGSMIWRVGSKHEKGLLHWIEKKEISYRSIALQLGKHEGWAGIFSEQRNNGDKVSVKLYKPIAKILEIPPVLLFDEEYWRLQ